MLGLAVALVLLMSCKSDPRVDFPAREPGQVLVLADGSEFECTCRNALPIEGFTCDTCDYHDSFGCQCWFVKATDTGAED
jgi:hypothetical protein